MENTKNIGKQINHAATNFVDLNALQSQHTRTSKFTYETMDEAIHKNENLMLNKRKLIQQAYYKEIAAEILKNKHLLLFGLTNAKTELYNYFQKDLHFKDIIFNAVPADNMTHNEKNTFLK